MNSPVKPHLPESGLSERVARLEVTCDRILDELREIRNDMREMRNTASTDFRILFGALIAVALGMSGVVARGFGWL